jgi:hypothetical protein
MQPRLKPQIYISIPQNAISRRMLKLKGKPMAYDTTQPDLKFWTLKLQRTRLIYNFEVNGYSSEMS